MVKLPWQAWIEKKLDGIQPAVRWLLLGIGVVCIWLALAPGKDGRRTALLAWLISP